MALRTIVLALALFAVEAQAQTPQDRERIVNLARNNFGHEAIECSAYLGVMAAFVTTRPDPDNLYQRTMAQSRALLKVAVDTALELGQKPEAVEARMEMAFERMKKESGGSAVNASILIQKYSSNCSTILNDPEARARYWLDQAMKELRK